MVSDARPGSGVVTSRRRLAAALACAAALSLAATPAGAIWPFRARSYPDPAKDLGAAAAELLAQAIRIRTVNPPGEERALAELYVRTLRREGVEAELIETPNGGRGAHRAAAWGRVAGTGGARPVILHSHLDVVDADPREWAVDPFEGIVGGGFVVGRGALDAKGIGVVHLLTLVELTRRARPLERDVIFLATPDEETGGQQGSGYLTREHTELLRDAEFLLTEGGGVLAADGGVRNVWGVAVTEKTPCWIRVLATGTPGHSSTEPRDAAVPRLLAALERVRSLETEIEVTPEVARMFASLAPLAPPEDRDSLSNLREALASHEAFRGRFLADRGQNALVRNTLAITVLQGSLQTNVVPAEAFAHVDARLLPGERCEDFAAEIRAAIDDPDVEVEPILAFAARSSPVDTALFRAIEATAAELDPGAAVVPRVIPGFTDAHYYRDLGIVAYGFVPRWLPAAESRSIHGANERISIENLERGVRTLTRILERLGGAAPALGERAPAARDGGGPGTLRR